MSILGWIVLGLLAGALAKLIMPGKQGGGILVTMVLGIVGAMLGGFLGGLLGINGSVIDGLNFTSFITAIIGSLLVLWIYGAVTKNKA